MREGDSQIGSAPENDIVLQLAGVSRCHARLSVRDGHVELLDLGSKNGLLVDGKRLHRIALGPGVFVKVGEAVVCLDDGPASDLDLAIESGRAASRADASSHETEPASAGSAPDSAVRALSFIRRIEREGGRVPPTCCDAVLADAVDVLGAAAIAILSSSDEGVVSVLHAVGPLPPESSLAPLLVDRPRRGGDAVRTQTVDGGVIALRRWIGHGADATLLAAFLPFDAQAAESWQRDFLDYLAEKLRAGQSRSRDGVPVQGLSDKAVSLHRAPHDELVVPAGMVLGRSTAMVQLIDQMRSTVKSRLDVLLLGETGTGKERFAELVHASGPAPEGPFVAINCAAIPSGLLESELFGVQRGVATGVEARVGRFAQASGGTIFLDEIGDMPEPLQAKLLRVLQEREVLPLGGVRPQQIDVRVVSASNRNLEEEVRAGHFRSDLFYRLRGLKFHIPPLRERREDIPELVLAFVSRAAEVHGKVIRGVTRKALDILMRHDWPGNIRELESEVSRAVLTCPQGGALDSSHFGAVRWAVDEAQRRAAGLASPPVASAAAAAEPAVVSSPPPPAKPQTLEERIVEVERQAIGEAMRSSGGNKALAARLLGITRNGLGLKLRRLGLLPGGRPEEPDR